LLSQPAGADPLQALLAFKSRCGGAGAIAARTVASGTGWEVLDLVCTFGPSDRRFEEQHESMSISVVLAGCFTYRSERGRELLSPGSLLLGQAFRSFECGHQHGEGDRCLSFQVAPWLFEEIGRDAGVWHSSFSSTHVPPLRYLAPLLAQARLLADGIGEAEELVLELFAAVQRHTIETGDGPAVPVRDQRRIGPVLRLLAEQAEVRHTLAELARYAGLSRYHFLRTFKSVTGVTPRQWLIRARLQRAAHLLRSGSTPVTEIAFEAGFEDLSNFIRTFRREFGLSPRHYRTRLTRAAL
jgi:AraC family transcriptional regulator